MRIYNMKKTLLITLCVSIMCIYKTNIINAYDDINFKNITIEDGLSQASAEVVFQDSKGYIWIGTNDGLNRYNGYDFKVYSYERESKNSIVNNYIIDIKEDEKGNIWVGTANGVSKIDTKNDCITNYLEGEENGNLSNYNIGDILITKDGRVIIATSNGLNIYNEKEDKFERILQNESDLTSQLINGIVEDDEGNIWIGTKNGLNKVDKNYNTIKKFYNNDHKNSVSTSVIYKLCYDKKGYIWVGSLNSGLSRVNIKTNEIDTYKHDSKNNKSIPDNAVKNMLRDSRGNFWVGTDDGLAKFNDTTEEFTVYKHKIYDKTSLVANEIFSIMEDKTGLIWVGTYSGISIFDPDNNIEHYKSDPMNNNSINDNVIQGIFEDEDGLLWVGTNSKGVNIIDRSTDTIINSSIQYDESNTSNYSIRDITGVGEKIYIATDNGINVINKKTKDIDLYLEEDNLANNNVRDLFLDSKGYLWIGTTQGISILNTADDTIVDYSYILENSNLNDTYVSSIYEDSEGNYYIGLFLEGGLIKIDANNNNHTLYKFTENENSISSNSIRDIMEDKEGNIWIATSYGLNKINKKNGYIENYTTKSGLPNNNIYGILIDDENNPWVSTNAGIAKLDINSNKFQIYDITDGLQGKEFNGNASFKNKEGELLFGGINGLNVFDPEKMGQSKTNENIVLEEFGVKGSIYKNIEGKNFKHDENLIKFKYFLADYKNTKSIQYHYKLEGIDQTWNITDDNEITYTNLNPGDYTFKIKAKNYDGTMSDEKVVKFKIDKPIWRSNLAIVIYIFIAIILIYANMNKVKRLDTLVENRTKQLRDEMTKNNILLNKVINLERNKNNYFINLSHELRTPLNVVSSTIQLICELNKKDENISKEKIDYYMNVMNKNSKRLLNLINNIIDSTKIQNEQYVMNIKPNDIVYLVEETALGLTDYAKSNGIKIIIDPEVEEKIVECDYYEIERCIVNLISNAIKFTPEDGEISISIKDLGDKVLISVKDSGIGIEEQYHKVIFDRFNQIIDVHTEVKGGSGLGLTITKQIIDVHKGKIYVESEIGKGSNFVIILPTTFK